MMASFGAFELDCGCVVTRRGGRLSRTCAEVRELLDLQDLYIEKGDAEAVEMYRNAVTRHLVEGIDFTAGG